MRLAIFLLFCVGLAAAVPLHSSDHDDLDEFTLQSEGGGRISERLKEHFEKIVNNIKKAFEDGKVVRGDVWKKAQDIYEKMKNLGVEVSEKLKTTFEYLRNKLGKNAYFFDSPMHLHSSDLHHQMFHSRFMLLSEGGGHMGERLKEHFENIINRIKKAFEDGTAVHGDLWRKAQHMYEKMQNLGVEVSEKLKTTFEDLRNKMGKNAYFFESPMHLHSSDLHDHMFHTRFMLKTEGGGRIGERLKEHFENIINRIKKAFEDGTAVHGDLWRKAQDMYEKMQNLGVEVSEKIKTTFEDLRNKMAKNAYFLDSPMHLHSSDIYDLEEFLLQSEGEAGAGEVMQNLEDQFLQRDLFETPEVRRKHQGRHRLGHGFYHGDLFQNTRKTF